MKYKIWIRGGQIILEEDIEEKYFSQSSIQEAVEYTAKILYKRIEEHSKYMENAVNQLKALEEWWNNYECL